MHTYTIHRPWPRTLTKLHSCIAVEEQLIQIFHEDLSQLTQEVKTKITHQLLTISNTLKRASHINLTNIISIIISQTGLLLPESSLVLSPSPSLYLLCRHSCHVHKWRGLWSDRGQRDASDLSQQAHNFSNTRTSKPHGDLYHHLYPWSIHASQVYCTSVLAFHV